jgi:hypothetical protein
VAEPREFEPMEIDDFVAFVMASGEVTPQGLRDRVMGASHIAFLREMECLIGVGGLKLPSDDYRKGIEGFSKTKLPAKEFPFELGWIFILPSARDRKLSFPLCQPLVAAASGQGVFATSRTTKGSMHRTLKNLGFIRVGSEWPSKENDGNLALFVRHAV